MIRNKNQKIKDMKTIKHILKTLLILLVVYSCTSNNDNPPENILNNIQGNWFRVRSNNPTNDGMLVNVDQDLGSIVNPMQSAFQVDDIKWKDIFSSDGFNFNYKELGGDYNYYDSQMELGSDDTLRITVNSSGAGNVQKWARIYTAPESHDCIPYDPATFDGAFEDNWSEINEVDAFSIMSVPGDDYGGGLVNVAVTTNSPVSPCLNLFAGSQVSTGLATGSNGSNTRTYRFIGHPGSSFSGETTDCDNAPSNQYPWDYTISYAYSGIMDCYEPNDIYQDAKAIPKNENISAYGVAGLIDGGTGIYEPQTYDWYKVTLAESKKIRATLNSCPNDIHMHFRFFKINNGNISNISVSTQEISGENHAPGSTYYIQSNNVLEPGTYLLEAHRLRGMETPDIVADGEANPEHWSTPYTFRVTTED